MTESWACPECGAEVPPGRLSCGACGAFLALVEGGPLTTPAASPGAPVARDDPPAALPPAPAAAPAEPTVPATPPPAPATLTPQPAAPVDAVEAVVPPPPPMPPIPGAYLPPSAVLRSSPVAAAAPARPAAPPGSLPAPASETPPTASPQSAAPPPRSEEPVGSGPGPSSRAPVLDLPFAIAPGAGPKLVAAGAALAGVAFVLPWIPDGGIVLGGSFGSGYFATWGLAALGNVPPFLLVLAGLLLAVLPNPLPRYAALGLLPVFLGGAFAALGWTYLIAPTGSGIGIWALVGGACLLLAGGWLVLRGGRTAG